MRNRRSLSLVLLALALLECLAVCGCSSAKRRWEDFTQYMHDEVARW
jgi:Tfp pilus assembly protein PilP